MRTEPAEKSRIMRGSAGLAPVVAAVFGLLISIFPAPLLAQEPQQEESVADAARRERERKKSNPKTTLEKEESLTDEDGFTWLFPGDHQAKYSEIVSRWEIHPGGPRYSAEECREDCAREKGCRAYKFEADRKTKGGVHDYCTYKTGDPLSGEPAPAAEEDLSGLGMFGAALVIDAALMKSRVPLPPALQKFSPAERKGLGSLLLMVATETECQSATGKYLTIEELEKGLCKNAKEGVKIEVDKAELQGDPNYKMEVNSAGGILTAAVKPKKPGMAGFFYNGTQVFADSGGATTSLGTPGEIMGSIAQANPKKK